MLLMALLKALVNPPFTFELSRAGSDRAFFVLLSIFFFAIETSFL